MMSRKIRASSHTRLNKRPRVTTVLMATITITAITAMTMITASPALADREELAPLFYTAAERQAITRARSSTPASEPDSAAKPTHPVRLDGLIQRSDGKSTLWLNGREASPEAISITGQPLRVGESVDPASGVRIDILPQGTISRRRGP